MGSLLTSFFLKEFMNAVEKYEYCRRITKQTLDKAKALDKLGEELLEWARNYYNDAEHYYTKEDYATALEAVAYAHGFIDAGVISGHVEVKDYHLSKRS